MNHDLTGRWARISKYFERAVESPPGDRLEWLDAVEPDPSIRQEVRALAAAHRGAEGFLEPGQLPFSDSDWLREVEGGRTRVTENLADSSGFESRPESIGPWTVVKELGTGGMGTVYLATRGEDQYRQTAAVKLIRAGRASEEIVRRFRRERQILATLEHPGIARMIDGGTTADGHPWLAMEYVAGEPLYDWCSHQNLGIVGRLEIFLAICDAVQHAHQNLVLHRDIKPGNILVTSSSGTPKLLDFGIAKLLGDEDPDVPPATRTLGAPLTPEYASPEQVLGSPLSTASDVYSLGVILYELLTGAGPYGPTATRSEILKAVMQSDVVRPSTAIRSSIQAASPHRSRSLPTRPPEPPSLLWRRLAGDLDNITLKALDRDASRRYAVVSQLAEDVRRFLTGQPVLARPATWRYRTTKFARRNRIAVISLGLTLISLTTGFSAALWQATVARKAQALAEKRLVTAHGLSKALIFDVFDSLKVVPGTLRVQEQMLSRTTEFLDKLSEDAGTDSVLILDLASAYERIGSVEAGPNVNLRRPREARVNFRKALDLRASVVRMDSLNERAQLALASSQARLGYNSLFEENDTLQAVALFEDAARRIGVIAARHPGVDGFQVRRVASLQNLAMAYSYTGQPARGRQMHASALAALRQMAARSPEDRNLQWRIAESSEAYARLLEELPGMADSIETLMLPARNWYETQVARDSTQLDYLIRAYGANYSLGDNQLYRRRDSGGALAYFERSLRQVRELRRREPNDGWSRFAEAGVRTARGRALTELGRLDEADEELRTQLTILRELARSDSTNNLIVGFLRDANHGLGLLEVARARRAPFTAAAPHWHAARDHLRAGTAISPYEASTLESGGVSRVKLAMIEKAIAACDSALEAVAR